MRAPRTRRIPEADAVAVAEGNNQALAMVRVFTSGGVCVTGMSENVQLGNPGDPASSLVGRLFRYSTKEKVKEMWEVGLPHSTAEVR